MFSGLKTLLSKLLGRTQPVEPVQSSDLPTSRLVRPPSAKPAIVSSTEESTDEIDEAVEAQWVDTVSDIVNNVDMETPYFRFVRGHIEQWVADAKTMPPNEVRQLISWLIVNANVEIIHDDITAVLDRIYQTMYSMV